MASYSVRKSSVLWFAIGLLFAISLPALAGAAGETTFGRIVVFGDSLSDPGNVFALKHELSTPPYATLDAQLIPDFPYAKGGHHFSNGATWIEQFARTRGLAGNVRPAYQESNSKAANYAVGAARAYEDGKNINLSKQVKTFLDNAGGQAASDGLFVVEIGGNDVRDALLVLAAGGDPGTIISASLASIGYNIGALHMAGANKFLVWNVPDLSLTPAILAQDKLFPGAAQAILMLEQAFNAGLAQLLSNLSGLPGIEIKRLDAFQLVNDLAKNPGAYGLDVVDAACVMPNVPPFECQTPDEFLFWDGIHPTRAVHAIIAQEASVVLSH